MEENLTAEQIHELELCVKEEAPKEVEGRMKNFFKKIFGMKTEEEPKVPENPTPLAEDTSCQDEVDEVNAALENWDGDPFVKDGKLYGQDYDKIKAKCEKLGVRFVDPWFPATSKSLFYTSPAPSLDWRRPNEICSEPKMFVDGADRFDINQGELGDCWLLAAMSSLSMDQDLFHQVLPPGQSFHTEDYTGAFKFRFWQYGEWVEVVVDDYLPVVEGNKLAFIHSDSRNEFWSALMEKAYAKLHGSYEALKGGSTCEAMVDFTGGCGEVFDLSKPPEDLFNILLHCYTRRSLNGCSIQADPFTFEARTKEGLVKGHAYTLTKVVKAKIETPRITGVIPLVRVRNPWGNETEWRGTWSDNAKEWSFIPEEEKEALGITFSADGEWWMAFKDFKEHFDQVEVCNLSPECLESCGLDKRFQWCVNSFNSAWISGETAGGCRNYIDTFASNPQFTLTLEDSSEDEDLLCTLIISLMQKNRRAMRDEGLAYLSLGFVIYRLKPEMSADERVDVDFFKYNLSVARSKSFINQREVTQRFRLEPGRYLIVPSTYDPGYEGEFLLRTFSEKSSTVHQIP